MIAKDKTRVQVTMTKERRLELENLSRDRGLKISQLINLAIYEYLKTLKSKKEDRDDA